jgi:DNA-binding transcriptional regulator YiaG
MTSAELKAVRAQLGLTQLQLGQWLGITGRDPGHTVRMWEIGKRSISGPITVLLEAFLSGWRPRHITNINPSREDKTNG